jgi:hypothetical protein
MELKKFFTDNVKDLLIILALIIAILGEFKETLRTKFWPRIAIITILIGTFLLQLFSDKKETKEQLFRYEKTITKADITIRNGDTTIKKLNVAFDYIRAVQQNINKQLKLQQNINKQATFLAKQNKEIAIKQQSVYGNVDRLLNPIFPLSITIFFSIPFDENDVRSLKEFAYRIKKEHNQLKKNYRYITFRPNILLNNPMVADTDICADIVKPDSVLSGSALNDFWNINSFNFSFIKDKVQLNCTLSAHFKHWKSSDCFLTIDYFDRKFNLKMEFDSYDFEQQFGKPSSGNLGFNDLLNSKIQFEIASASENYQLVAVGLGSESGLQNDYLFLFSEKDVVRNKYNGKIYYHTITNSDVGIKQPREVFFDR